MAIFDINLTNPSGKSAAVTGKQHQAAAGKSIEKIATQSPVYRVWPAF